MSFLRMLRNTSGAAAIEFAIVGVVMISLSLGLIEFGRAFYLRNQIAHAADLAARKVLMNGSVAESELSDTIRQAFSGPDPELLEIVFGNESIDGVEFRTMLISYPLALLVPGLASDSVSLRLDRRVPLT